MDRVKDKVIVITGAASGLGLADSRVLAREGAQVVMTDIDPEAGQAHANEVGDPASISPTTNGSTTEPIVPPVTIREIQTLSALSFFSASKMPIGYSVENPTPSMADAT